MSTDQTVVSDLIFWTGLHRVEVIRFGKPVDEAAAAQRLVPGRCRESVTMFDWVEDEKGLNLHHLYVNWKERGAVDYSGEEWARHAVPLRYGVLWYIAPGESLSFSADVAADLYRQRFGVMPSAAWVRKMPRGSIDRTPLARTNSDARVHKNRVSVGEGADAGFVELMVGEWVPERFVVVGVSG